SRGAYIRYLACIWHFSVEHGWRYARSQCLSKNGCGSWFVARQVAPNYSIGNFPVIQTASALFPLLLLLRAGARCSSGPLCGGEAGTIRPRSGRCHGGQRLFARTGVRSKSPATTHGLGGQDARRASHRGVVSSWLLLLWTSKGEVTRAPAGARNRSVADESVRAKAPLPYPSSSLLKAGLSMALPRVHKWARGGSASRTPPRRQHQGRRHALGNLEPTLTRPARASRGSASPRRATAHNMPPAARHPHLRARVAWPAPTSVRARPVVPPGRVAVRAGPARSPASKSARRYWCRRRSATTHRRVDAADGTAATVAAAGGSGRWPAGAAQVRPVQATSSSPSNRYSRRASSRATKPSRQGSTP